MLTVEDTERRLATRQAVEETYQALGKYHVSHRRIVFLPDDYKRAGGYGIVLKAYLHSSAYLPAWLASRRYGPPQLVAVKQIKISAADNTAEVKRAFTKEMLVWSSLKAHPGIAKFLGFYANAELSEAWLLSPWEPSGNIGEFVRKYKLEVPEKLSLIYDTIDALEFLHQLTPPVCHGDIKSANVMVNSSFRAVLCDFGLARLFEDSGFGRLETSTGFKGSIRWCGPELINGQPRRPSSDVYAWAWLIWEIMTGELPYQGTSADYAIIFKIFEGPQPHVDGEFRLSECLQVWELMTRCWVAVPEERPTSNMCRTSLTLLPRCPPTLTDHAHSATLLEGLGDLKSWKGNYEEGLAHLGQALTLYEEEGNDRGVTSVLRKRATALYRHADPLGALQAASAALDKLENLGDTLGTAEAMYLMGSSLPLLSRFDDAMAFLNEAMEIFHTHDHKVGVVGCLERMGEVHKSEYRYEEALSAFEKAVTIAARCGDKFGEARVLMGLGSLEIYRDRLTEAATIVLRASEIAKRIGWERGIGTALLSLGTIQRLQGSGSEGEDLLRESISVCRRCKFRCRLAQGLWGLGFCLQTQGRLDEAAAALEESCSLYLEMSTVGDLEFPPAARFLAKLKGDLGASLESLCWYDVAIAEYRKLQDKHGLSACLADKGCILKELNKGDEAALHFEAALVLDRELGNDQGVGWNRLQLRGTAKTVISWESRKFAKPRPARDQQTSPLLCNVNKLQRRIPHLATTGLKLEIRINGGGNG